MRYWNNNSFQRKYQSKRSDLYTNGRPVKSNIAADTSEDQRWHNRQHQVQDRGVNVDRVPNIAPNIRNRRNKSVIGLQTCSWNNNMLNTIWSGLLETLFYCDHAKVVLYLTTHSTHFIYSYLDIWLSTIQITRQETHFRHLMDLSFRLQLDIFICISCREDSTYHSLCYSRCEALAGTRNCSISPPKGIDLMTHLPLSYVPLLDTKRLRFRCIRTKVKHTTGVKVLDTMIVLLLNINIVSIHCSV